VIPTLRHYSDIVSDIPSGSIYWIYIPTFYLTSFLAYTLTFFLAFYLASILTYFLAYMLAFFLASILTFFLACRTSTASARSQCALAVEGQRENQNQWQIECQNREADRMPK
jgi:hypothetical protein